ncbi:RcnB family protein [Frateuria aurantia]
MKRTFALVVGGLIASASLSLTAVAAPQQHGDGPQGHGPAQHGNAGHGSFKQNGKDVQYGKGQRLPQQFRGNDRYISNYGAYHLSRPPAGHRWVRDDSGNFVLVAVATGLITQILAGH